MWKKIQTDTQRGKLSDRQTEREREVYMQRERGIERGGYRESKRDRDRYTELQRERYIES